ncbi:MAG: hypothetical protein CYPHOPRED_003135 [Cyphobasidiales sp. Tagirdzhanova-0007]|nr:MAG: hypothetical protein CYPHOPRED_003135 [Cyphobasidiales sp. Tagirdzhanova-0007]
MSASLQEVVQAIVSYNMHINSLSGQSSPGILQFGQVPSNATLQIPHTSSSSSSSPSSSPSSGATRSSALFSAGLIFHRHDATAL